MCLQKGNKQKNKFFAGTFSATDEKSRTRIRKSVVQSADPDPYQNVTDSQHYTTFTS
jgi:hypothetical protein